MWSMILSCTRAWCFRPQVEVEGVTQLSSVHIKRCRYLAESGCAGMCINLCKSPTQVRLGPESSYERVPNRGM